MDRAGAVITLRRIWITAWNGGRKLCLGFLALALAAGGDQASVQEHLVGTLAIHVLEGFGGDANADEFTQLRHPDALLGCTLTLNLRLVRPVMLRPMPPFFLGNPRRAMVPPDLVPRLVTEQTLDMGMGGGLVVRGASCAEGASGGEDFDGGPRACLGPGLELLASSLDPVSHK